MKALIVVEADSVEQRVSKASGNSYSLQLVRFKSSDMPQFRDVQLYVPPSSQALPVGKHICEFPVEYRNGKLQVGFPAIAQPDSKSAANT